MLVTRYDVAVTAITMHLPAFIRNFLVNLENVLPV